MGLNVDQAIVQPVLQQQPVIQSIQQPVLQQQPIYQQPAFQPDIFENIHQQPHPQTVYAHQPSCECTHTFFVF